MKFFFQKKSRQRGITILVAVLVTSILLAIGLSIFNTTLKDLVFASTGRESEIAFFAADTGIECAQYWDLKGNGGLGVFATSSDSTFPGSIICNGNSVALNVPSDTETDSQAVTTFSLSDPCVDVTVTKTLNSAGSIDTKLEAKGHNKCPVNSSSRVVERGIVINY